METPQFNPVTVAFVVSTTTECVCTDSETYTSKAGELLQCMQNFQEPYRTYTEDNADAVAPSWLEGADAAQPNLCDIRIGLDKNNKLQANWTIALCYYESEGTPSLKKPALKKALQASMLSQGSQQFGRITVTKGRI